jgi:hypothetical protein
MARGKDQHGRHRYALAVFMVVLAICLYLLFTTSLGGT